MELFYFHEVEAGESFITWTSKQDGEDYMGWFVKLIEPEGDYNAVSIDNGELIYFPNDYPVVLNREE